MHSTTIFASALAFAASAMAQVEGFAVMTAPAKGEVVPAGQTYTVVWSAGAYTGPVSLGLLAGATPETLMLGNAIASNVEVSSGSFKWAVDCSLGKEATYGIKITSVGDESLFQYSFPFKIDNSACGGSQSSSSSAAPGYSTSEAPGSSTSCSSSATASYTASASVYPTLTSSASNATVTSVTSAASSAVVSITTGFSNSTIVTPTLTASSTLDTTVTSAPTSTGGASASASASSIPTGAAGKNAAGSLALIGGLAAVAFAL